MEDKKPISLNSLVFSDEKGNRVFRKDYFMEFETLDYATTYIEAENKKYSELYGIKLVFSEDTNETLTEIEIKRVLRLTARFLNLRYRDVISKSQKRELVDARRYAVIICLTRGKTRSSICEFLHINASTIPHHIKQFKNHCDAYQKYQETYYECFEYVMQNLNPAGGNIFKEDGSGEEIEIDESEETIESEITLTT
jgi:hypothetical protein